MAKVTITKLDKTTAREIGKRHGVVVKRVRSEDGEVRTLSSLDAGSKSFRDDLTHVFGKNVAKARKENKRVTGVSDRVPTKS